MKKCLTVIALCLMILPLQGCLGVKVVNAGERGVLTRFGKVEEVLPPGLHFYNPFTESVTSMEIRTQKMESDMECYTKDIQQAKMHVIINYNLSPDKAGEMYQNVGYDWEQKLIPQTAQGVLKAAIGRWDAVDLIANRTKATQDIQDTLEAVLATKNISVTRVEIANIDYSTAFETAVENKVKAIQEAEQQKNVTVNVQEQAKQTVMRAQAEAQAMQIKAQALSQNAALVQWEAVQKWNGAMPVYMMGNSVPLINLQPKQ